MSRTKFQHMSGTRGPVDFVETPSHLMENFVRDHRSLKAFAFHHITGEAVPAEKVGSCVSKRKTRQGARSEATKRCDEHPH